MKKTGVLMIHGTFGSPREFTPLEVVLQNKGYRTQTVTLPGHGDTPQKLLVDVTQEDILQECRYEYHRLSQNCDEVLIVGHSLGGLCGLIMAAEQPAKLKGIVALAAPFEHGYFINYQWGFFITPPDRILMGYLYDREIMTLVKQPLFYPWWFPQLYFQAQSMFNTFQTVLPDIKTEVVLAHSTYDMIVPYEEMAKIAHGLKNAKSVVQHTLSRCGHQIFPKSQECDPMIDMIFETLKIKATV